VLLRGARGLLRLLVDVELADGESECLSDLFGGAQDAWCADDRRNSDQDVLDLLDGDTGVPSGLHRERHQFSRVSPEGWPIA
jgi:hypothetical protein